MPWLLFSRCVRVFVVFNCLTWLRSLKMEMLLVLDSGGLFYVFVLLNGFNIQQIAAGCLQISRLWRRCERLLQTRPNVPVKQVGGQSKDLLINKQCSLATVQWRKWRPNGTYWIWWSFVFNKNSCLPQAFSIKGKSITFPWHSNSKIPHKSLLWVARLQMVLRMLVLSFCVQTPLERKKQTFVFVD